MGNSSDNNDKTQLLSESQVVEVKPAPAAAPKPPDDKNDRTFWKGLVVGADEFAPPAAAKRSRGPWLVIGILVAAAIGGGAYVLYGRGGSASHPADAAKPDSAPPDAARPDARAPDAAPPIDAPAPDAPLADAAVADAPPADAGVKPPPKVIKKKLIPLKKKPVLRKAR